MSGYVIRLEIIVVDMVRLRFCIRVFFWCLILKNVMKLVRLGLLGVVRLRLIILMMGIRKNMVDKVSVGKIVG